MATALISRVRAITGSTTTQSTDANLVDFVEAGVKFVYTSIPKDLLWQFASDGANIVDSSGQSPYSDTILGVRRNSIECDQIPLSDAYAQISTYSTLTYKEATAIFPVYYLQAGKVYIKPDPDASNVGVVTSLALPTVTTTTSDTWSLAIIDVHIINYASALDYKACASYWRKQSESTVGTQVTAIGTALTAFAAALPDAISLDTDLPDAISLTETLPSAITLTATLPAEFSVQSLTPVYVRLTAALDNALKFINDYTTTDALSYLTGDDPEMVAPALSAAQSEISRAAQELGLERTKIEKYVADIGQELQQTTADLNRYKADLEQEVQAFNTEISGYSADLQAEVQALTTEVQKYKSESDHAIGVYTTGLAAAKAYIDEAMARIHTLKSAETYLLSAQTAYNESAKCYEMAVSGVEIYVKNNSKMIQAQFAAGGRR